MVGCDLSLSSLRGLVLYQRRIQADAATCIPLPDNSVDAVVSSYFWEHIRPIAKPHILQECRRILKPGGKIIFLYDVATENPLIRRHRRSNPHLYEKLFVQGDGHWGYQSSEENLAIFKNGNFEVVEHRGMEKTWIQSPSVYSKLSQFGTVGSGILAVAARLSQPPFFYLHATLLRLVDTLICPMLPGGWARVDMVVCRKSHP
jgi:SAM-dependent methyltransferase